MCHNGFIWNPSNCECKCDKTNDVGEYLGRKKLVYKIVDEFTENVEEVKLAKINLT